MVYKYNFDIFVSREQTMYILVILAPDAVYQVSRSSASWFRIRRFLKVFTIYRHGGHFGHVTYMYIPKRLLNCYSDFFAFFKLKGTRV